MKMAEGRGFEPPVTLRLRLISSQVPLTTQPPFLRCSGNTVPEFVVAASLICCGFGDEFEEEPLKKEFRWDWVNVFVAASRQVLRSDLQGGFVENGARCRI